MLFDKQEVLSMISDPAQAEQAAQQLPEKVDHVEHSNLLQQFGVDPNQLASSSQGQDQLQDAGQQGSSGF
jgi:hypothetical protein